MRICMNILDVDDRKKPYAHVDQVWTGTSNEAKKRWMHRREITTDQYPKRAVYPHRASWMYEV